MLKDKSMTYVTLFSSAGVGCHGFQMEGYHCIATNEIIARCPHLVYVRAVRGKYRLTS